ncbi:MULTISPECIES: YrhB domain-containing protein [unclassified Stenotrophomonas maltophilia group]|uniref:YrhB domain-containing protein n=1 Tax=unclassified Stenotrophomonas maltophilia group TaxID=2961925 RepID=UPI00131ED97C|nr:MULTISPECIES: YrhB domain-containing protein [unclassified Stenotrophomonas maltophilia group]
MNEIGFATARALAAQSLVREPAYEGEPMLTFVVLDSLTEEYPGGWLFFYGTAAFAAGDEDAPIIAGNGPIFIERTGTLHSLPTWQHWHAWLAERGFREPSDT